MSLYSEPNVVNAQLANRSTDLDLAKANYEVSKVSQKANYDSQNKALLDSRRFKVGDLVQLKTHYLSDSFKKFSAGLAEKYEGPYVISFIFGNGTFQLNDVVTKKCVCKAHFNQLKPVFQSVDNMDNLKFTNPNDKSAKTKGRKPGQKTNYDHRNVAPRDNSKYNLRSF